MASTVSSSERRVRKNTLWNFAGQGLPLAFAVFFIPRLISELGIERFGALTIVWTVLNYFGLFDLGIGRALTQLLAGKAQGDKREEATLIWTVSALLVVLGGVAGALLFLGTPFLTARLLRLEGPLGQETALALRELAIALPFLIHTIALKGVLDARRRFDISNMIRIPLGVFMYGAPLLIIPFTKNLGVIVAVLLAGRGVAWLVNLVAVFRIMPHVKEMFGWEPRRAGELLRFGGWFTVSSVVGPVIDNMDRFFINAILTLSVVAYFTTPFEVVSKAVIVSYGVGAALFPEFATRFLRGGGEAQALFMRAIKYLLMVMFPLTLILTAYAQEGLSLWLTPEFGRQSGPVLQWLAVYLLIVSVSQVSFTFLLGIGRPALPAILHVIELPIYAGMLYYFLKTGGIEGAAIAAVCRIAIDFLGQLWFCGSRLRFKAVNYGKILLPVAGTVLVLFGFHLPLPPVLKAVLVTVVLLAHAGVSWAYILEKSDKASVLNVLRRVRGARPA